MSDLSIQAVRLVMQALLFAVGSFIEQLLGTLHVGAGLGGIAEVYERVSGDTIGSCVICSIIAGLN